MFWTTDYHDYIVCQSVSSNGSITGDWTFKNIIYDNRDDNISLGKDAVYPDRKVTGGHSGFVTTPEGQLYMTLHTCMWEWEQAGSNLP
jgi:hypothetical protein